MSIRPVVLRFVDGSPPTFDLDSLQRTRALCLQISRHSSSCDLIHSPSPPFRASRALVPKMSNASALLSALNSRPQSSLHHASSPFSQHPLPPNNQQHHSFPQGPPPPTQDDPASPGIQHNHLDPWATNGASHLPLSISQSINNPGLPSGVIVSSAAVNAMNGLGNDRDGQLGHGRGGSGGQSRSETPGLPNINGGGGSGPGGGGKLLLQGGMPLATSSLIQPGSVPGAQGQTENEKVYYLIVDLMNVNTREAALLELSKKREQWDDLALVLWHSFGP